MVLQPALIARAPICSPKVVLAKLYPDQLSLGIEIRVKVADYVRDRIAALRKCVG